MVELGGSSVNNLADNLLPVRPGARLAEPVRARPTRSSATSWCSSTPTSCPATTRWATSSTRPTCRRWPSAGALPRPRRTCPTFAAGDKVKQVVSAAASWQISFDTGQATFTAGRAGASWTSSCATCWSPAAPRSRCTATPTARATRSANMSLSEERAFAVKSWLEQQSPVNFPKGRIRVFAHGQAEPGGAQLDGRGPRPEPPRRDRARHHRHDVAGVGPASADRSPARPARRVFAPNRALSRRPPCACSWRRRRRSRSLFWWLSPLEVLPNPAEVVTALRGLWFEQGLGRELITSFTLNLEALGLTLRDLLVALLPDRGAVLPPHRRARSARAASSASSA